MDIKDILGLSRTASTAGEKAEKPKEKKMVKPKGMSRSVASECGPRAAALAS